MEAGRTTYLILGVNLSGQSDYIIILETKEREHWFYGGSPVLVVMGGDTCSRDLEIEYHYGIVDGSFFQIYLF